MRFHRPHLPAKRGLRIAHLSDLHLGKSAAPDHRQVFLTWWNWLGGLGIDVFVVSGDIVHTPDDAAMMDWFCDAIVGRDTLVIPGNHDLLDPAKHEVFTQRFGGFPRSEVRGNVELLLFDSFAGVAKHERDAEELARLAEGKAMKHGRVSESQYAHFAVPQAATRIAVIHHHPEEPRPEDDGMVPLRDADRFLAWCSGAGVSAVLYGHVHKPAPVWTHNDVVMFRGSAATKVPSMVRILDVGDTVAWTELTVGSAGP